MGTKIPTLCHIRNGHIQISVGDTITESLMVTDHWTDLDQTRCENLASCLGNEPMLCRKQTQTQVTRTLSHQAATQASQRFLNASEITLMHPTQEIVYCQTILTIFTSCYTHTQEKISIELEMEIRIK